MSVRSLPARALTWVAVAAAAGPLAAAAGCGVSSGSRAYGAMLDDYARARPPAPGPDDALFAGADHLDRGALIGAVLARNPDLGAAREAWRAALARYPQATTFDDPVVSYSLAPLSIAGSAPFGQAVQVEERLPVPGRRRLAGQVALAEAEAARGAVESARVELAVMASTLYDDYWFTTRSLAINAQHAELVTGLKRAAEAQYAAARGSAQDSLEAETELVRLDHDRVMLEAGRAIAVAGLNGLLHRRPETPLPPPPDALDLPAGEPPAEATLEDEALAARPELATQRARVRAGRAAAELARRDTYPRVGVMARYDSMRPMTEHQWMVGLSFALPVMRGTRHAAVAGAEAASARAGLAYDHDVDRIRVEVAQAYQRLMAARHLLGLYDDRLLPAARDRVGAARADFVTAKARFSEVIAAERELRDAELGREETMADVSRLTAALDRAVGRVPATGGAR